MATTPVLEERQPQTMEAKPATGYRFWLILLGIALMVAGAFAVTFSITATIASVLTFGALLIVAAVGELFFALRFRSARSFAFDLIFAVLHGALGFFLIRNPFAGAVGLTLLLGIFLIASGVMRMGLALGSHYSHAGWLTVMALLNVLLGVMILAGWPVSGLWVIGLFVGIELLITGSVLTFTPSAVRQMRQPISA